MKKIVLLVFFVFLSSSVFAISVDIKNNYLPRQTVIAKISGEVLDILTKDNIQFRRGHVAIPLEHDLKKIGEEYYIWFITPFLENNYTIIIKNIATTVGGFVKRIDYEKNFSVIGNASYSIKPGFVYATKDFEIAVLLYEDERKQIKVNFLDEQEIVLKPGNNLLKFSIGSINESGFYNLTIGEYNVPAYIIPNKTFYKKINETNVTAKNIIIEYEIKNKTKINETKKFEVYCYEYPGKICGNEEICDGETRETIDGFCCIGTCKGKEKQSSALWGYLLIIVVVAILGYIGWKYYKTKEERKNILQKNVAK
ncbi:MAG: hypothetical protein N3D20_00195 [Candidatus Pacearchaeota archaeon]|nr:hypothetical protein [Candidatus Pacearchaeota archaeon]